VAIAMQRGVAGAKINVASHELKDIVNTCTPGADLFLGENGQITETPAMDNGGDIPEPWQGFKCH